MGNCSHKIKKLAFVAADGLKAQQSELEQELAQPLTGQESSVTEGLLSYVSFIFVLFIYFRYWNLPVPYSSCSYF